MSPSRHDHPAFSSPSTTKDPVLKTHNDVRETQVNMDFTRQQIPAESFCRLHEMSDTAIEDRVMLRVEENGEDSNNNAAKEYELSDPDLSA